MTEEKRRNLCAALNVLRCLKMKPNYSELERQHGISRQTIKKYDEGFKPKKTKKRSSMLDPYVDEIKAKLSLPGATITGVYHYIAGKYSGVGKRSNFDTYVRKRGLIQPPTSPARPRYETALGEQLQFDFKENVTMTSKQGEVFHFHLLTTTLGASRAHTFNYCKDKTYERVTESLIKSFRYYGGVAKELLTDNMSAIVNTKTGKFYEPFKQFASDFGFTAKTCRVRTPQTKGKVESANRFIQRLIPYNGEFEDEHALITLIAQLTDTVNQTPNQTTGIAPQLLLQKEKEYLLPLPSDQVIETYLHGMFPVKVHADQMIYYRGKRYSVPSKYIRKTLKARISDMHLHLYHNTQLVRIHPLSDTTLNYHKDDYYHLLASRMPYKEKEELLSMTKENLARLDHLKG